MSGDQELISKAAAIFEGLNSCGSNSCLIKAPTGAGNNSTCRCHHKSTVMLQIIARATAVVRVAKRVEAKRGQ